MEGKYASLEQLRAVFEGQSVPEVVGRFFKTPASETQRQEQLILLAESARSKHESGIASMLLNYKEIEAEYRKEAQEDRLRPNPLGGERLDPALAAFLEKHHQTLAQHPVLMDILCDPEGHRFGELLDAFQSALDSVDNIQTRKGLAYGLERLRRRVSDYTSLLNVGVNFNFPSVLRSKPPGTHLCHVEIKSEYGFQSLTRDRNFDRIDRRYGYEDGSRYSGVLDRLFPRNEIGDEEFNTLKEMFFHPLADVEQIKERQAMIRELQSLADGDAFKAAKGAIDEFCNHTQALFALYADDVWSISGDGGSSMTDMFHMGEQVFNQTVYADEERVSYQQLCQNIAEALAKKEAAAERATAFFEHLRAIPSITGIAQDSLEAFTNLQVLLDRDFFLEGKDLPNSSNDQQENAKQTNDASSKKENPYISLETWKKKHTGQIEIRGAKATAAYHQINRLQRFATTISALYEVAMMCQREGWCPVTFDTSRPTEYKQAWHAAHSANEEVANDSPADRPFTVFSGANDSGKSHSGLQRDILLRMAAQAWGMVPAKECNLRTPASQLIYHDRSGTKGNQRQSAFQAEAKDMASSIETIRERIVRMQATALSPDAQASRVRWYLDEPGSSTAPADQFDVIHGTREQIKPLEIDLIISTHNEVVISQAIDDPTAGCYYFEYDMDTSGGMPRLRPSYRMREGMGESHSFEVAARHHASPKLIALARAHDEGGLRLSQSPKQKAFPAFVPMSPEQRTALKAEARSIGQLFERSLMTLGSLAIISSDDPDLNKEQLRPLIIWPDHIDQPLNNPDSKYFGGFLLELPVDLIPAEILERQRLFQELGDERRLQVVCTATNILTSAEDSYALIDKARTDGINRALCPFDDERQMGASARSAFVNLRNLKDCYSFLKLNRKLLSDNFPVEADALMREMRTMANILKKRKHLDVIVKLTEVEKHFFFGLPQLNDQEEKTLRDIFAKIGPPAAGSEQTLRGLRGYLEQLARRMQSIRQSLPKLDLHDIDLQKIEPELQELCRSKDMTITDESKAMPISSLRNDFRSVLIETDLAYALLQLPFYDQAMTDIESALSSADSVYLAQAAPHLRSIYTNMQNALSTPPNDWEIGRRTYKGQLLWTIPTGGRNNFFGRRGRQKGVLSEEINHLKTITALAATIKGQQMAPVQFNNTGEIHLENGFHLLRGKAASEPNTLHLKSDGVRLQILTGPNGSGKTFFEQQSLLAVLFAYATGHAPADSATLPLLRPILADRLVKNIPGQGSFASELTTRWKSIIPALQGDKPCLLIGDECFSTVSPRYQEAFIAAAVQLLHANGHFGIVATHNHPAVDWACESENGAIRAYHFDYRINPDNTLTYLRKLKEGHAQSLARQAAKTVGFDLEAKMEPTSADRSGQVSNNASMILDDLDEQFGKEE